ncbi:phosphonoacetaldehyde reductase [Marinobacter panjinensis]|uniref:Phosphonoacetaldehyde reductase n=1 Tax=Marinobacter panjinensis TaxID=2576384 RepID=A0A4U6QRD6_9GAMM|nr:phosphonoacetaldehyde reductase [Marinobacter panjinensis]MCR8916442.1 phosphonoacetaldehyde reductase [Marinobacter panjinensis]TKV63340.1 phosphonoacetaldehyde reductase [Marinobacter panjinensis]
MTHWSHYNPVTIHAGPGAFDKLGDLASAGQWLLVTTAGFTRRGVTDRVRALVGTDRLSVFDEVTPNPDLDHLDSVAASLKATPLDGIIALGGGSAIDAAKVLAVILKSDIDAPLDHILRGNKAQAWTDKLPLIAVPTTAGTGAEVTPFATVWDHTANKKYSVTGDRTFPDYAILDPQLTLSLPEDETLYTALDTISHALESLWNKNRTVISETYALRALALANDALPALLATPDNLDQRERMQQASMLAGLAICTTRTAIAHAISYPMTLHYGIPHGLACSFTLPGILQRYIPTLQEGPERQAMEMTLRTLESADLMQRVSKYLGGDDPSQYLGEMFQPDRAGNFSRPIDQDILRDLLSNTPY